MLNEGLAQSFEKEMAQFLEVEGILYEDTEWKCLHESYLRDFERQIEAEKRKQRAPGTRMSVKGPCVTLDEKEQSQIGDGQQRSDSTVSRPSQSSVRASTETLVSTSSAARDDASAKQSSNDGARPSSCPSRRNEAISRPENWDQITPPKFEAVFGEDNSNTPRGSPKYPFETLNGSAKFASIDDSEEDDITPTQSRRASSSLEFLSLASLRI